MTTSTKRSENKKEGIHYICRKGMLTIPPNDVTDMQTITIAISWESPVMVNSEIFHILNNSEQTFGPNPKLALV